MKSFIFCSILIGTFLTSQALAISDVDPITSSKPNIKIDREGIRKTFFTNQSAVQKCYTDMLASQKDLNGKLTLDFDIDDKGKVTRATWSEEKSRLKSPELAKCITEKIVAWEFPKSPKGTTVQVFYPMAFSTK